jgi:cupin 2 domain-containing protein
MQRGNLFDQIEALKDEEQVDSLLNSEHARILRIVSKGHRSAYDFWYDQQDDEFVVLVSGAARLEFEGVRTAMDLKPGDWTFIPAHEKHRIAWTDPNQESVWLAMHINSVQ